MSMPPVLASLLAQLSSPAPAPSEPRRDLGVLALGVARLTVELNDEESQENRNSGTSTVDLTGTSNLRSFRNRTILQVDTTDPEEYNTPRSQVGDDNFLLASATSTLDSSSKAGSTHAIFIFPFSEAELETICLKPIGVGVTTCIRKNCTMNHRGWLVTRQEDITIGTIAVLKDKSSIFSGTYVNVDIISDEVIMEWKNGPKRSIDQWTSLFRMAANAHNEHGIITADLLESETTYQDYANRFVAVRGSLAGGATGDVLSPLGSKFTTFKSLSDALNNAVKRKAVDDANITAAEIGAKRRIFLTGDETPADAFYILEQVVEATRMIVGQLTDKLDASQETVAEELHILFTKNQVLDGTVGKRIEVPGNQFQAPTVWGTVAVLAGAVQDIAEAVNDFPSTMKVARADMIQRLSSIETLLRETVCEATKSVQGQVTEIEDGLIKNEDMIEVLSTGMTQLAEIAVDLRNEVRSMSNTTTSSEDSGQKAELASLKETIKLLTKRIDDLAEDKSSQAQKFFGVTLRDQPEANVWVSANLEPDQLGIIVDVPLVLEHVFYQAFATEGLLKTLQKLYKVKIENIAQGLACSSFDVRIPKFFHSGMTMADIAKNNTKHNSGPNVSVLNVVDSWERWNQSSTGYRYLLEAQLIEFKKAQPRCCNVGIYETRNTGISAGVDVSNGIHQLDHQPGHINGSNVQGIPR